jgi:hypothetical protein
MIVGSVMPRPCADKQKITLMAQPRQAFLNFPANRTRINRGSSGPRESNA